VNSHRARVTLQKDMTLEMAVGFEINNKWMATIRGKMSEHHASNMNKYIRAPKSSTK
jgi:hypothetical protein